MSIDPDAVHRTAKILLDAGEADSIAAAEAELGRYVLQIDVGPGISGNATPPGPRPDRCQRRSPGLPRRCAGEAGGGLRRGDWMGRWTASVRGRAAATAGSSCPPLWKTRRRSAWARPRRASAADRSCARPSTDGPQGWSRVLKVLLADRSWFVPAGVAAGGIAVAEAFQVRRGDPRAGRRRQGISLWRPELDWERPDAVGPQDSASPPAASG